MCRGRFWLILSQNLLGLKRQSRYAVGALIVTVAMTVATPAMADAGDVLDTLLSCKPDFFEVLKSEKAVFGPTKIMTYPAYEAQGEEGSGLRGNLVAFAKPIEAYGLHIRGYLQSVVITSGQPELYRWGFAIVEAPDAAAKVIVARSGNANFNHWSQSYEWALEPDEPVEEKKLPLRGLSVGASALASFPGSVLRCVVHQSRMNGLEALPSPYDLFVPSFD